MAKAEDTDDVKFRFGKGGQGWRQCPSCDCFVRGAATKICTNPKCGKPMPTSEKKIKTEPESQASNTEEILRFALRNGGFEKAIAKIEEIKKKIDADMRLVFSLGGPEALEAIIKEEEAKTKPAQPEPPAKKPIKML